MQSSWPDGVTSYQDMCSHAKTLFSEQCTIEDLLRDVPEFAKRDGCFLIRVKGACNKGNWTSWPKLIDEAMTATENVWTRRCHTSQVQSIRCHSSTPV